MTVIPLVLLVVLAATTAPVAAQVPVYTNADLGKPLARITTITPEQFASIVARQFVYQPPWPTGPTVTIVPYAPPVQVVQPWLGSASDRTIRIYTAGRHRRFDSRGPASMVVGPGPVHRNRARSR